MIDSFDYKNNYLIVFDWHTQWPTKKKGYFIQSSLQWQSLDSRHCDCHDSVIAMKYLGVRRFVPDKFVFGGFDYLFAVGVWSFRVGVQGFWARDEFWVRIVYGIEIPLLHWSLSGWLATFLSSGVHLIWEMKKLVLSFAKEISKKHFV